MTTHSYSLFIFIQIYHTPSAEGAEHTSPGRMSAANVTPGKCATPPPQNVNHHSISQPNHGSAEGAEHISPGQMSAANVTPGKCATPQKRQHKLYATTIADGQCMQPHIKRAT